MRWWLVGLIGRWRAHPVVCGILVPRPGIELMPSAMEAWSLNHWTTREVPRSYLFGVWVVKYRVETAPLLAEPSAREVVFSLSSALSYVHYFLTLCRETELGKRQASGEVLFQPLVKCICLLATHLSFLVLLFIQPQIGGNADVYTLGDPQVKTLLCSVFRVTSGLW